MGLIMSNTVINGARQANYTTKRLMKNYQSPKEEVKETGLLQRPEKKESKDDPFIEELILRIQKGNYA